MKKNSEIFKFLNKFIFIFTIILFSEFSISKIYANNQEDNFIESEYLKIKDDDFYILGEGDALIIDIIDKPTTRIVPDDQENELYNVNALVDQNGQVNLPEIGKIYVSGLTISELENLLDKEFKKFIINPNLNIRLAISKPLAVNIIGEVKNPGIYKFSYGRFNEYGNVNFQTVFPEQIINANTELNTTPTIFEAIRRAGGITSFSSLKDIEVIRINPISKGGGLIKTQINLLSVLNSGDTSQNIKLMNNDLIKIKKSSENMTFQIKEALKSNINSPYIKVYISGEVQDAGALKLLKNADLNTAILTSGGQSFFKGSITLSRYTNDGGFITKKIAFNKNSKSGSEKNPYLNEGDIIFVGKPPIRHLSEIVTDITRPFLGIYSTYKIFD